MIRILSGTFLLSCALLFLPFATSHAQTPDLKPAATSPVEPHGPVEPKRQHAFALHGSPKYGPDFTHLDYTNPDAPKGGTLNLSALGTFDSFNPYIIKGTPAAGLRLLGQSFVYDSLMEQTNDEPFSMYGLIAESVEHPDDNRWVAFNLRPIAKFHDGKPVTAEDVAWTFNTLIKHGAPFYKAYYEDVRDVIVEDTHRIKFAFKHGRNKELPLILAQLPVLPKHYWTSEGRDFTKSSLIPPLGSGPYTIGKVEAGRSVEYTRVADWWGKDLPLHRGRYNFDKIRYTYYRDANVALEAFFAGEYDVREENIAKLWETNYDAPAIKDGRITKSVIPNQRPTGMQGWIYNIRKPVFSDPRVREALAYAFDFDWSNKQFAYGSYTRTNSFFENSDLASSGLPQGKELALLEKYRGKIPDAVFTTEYQPPKTDGTGNNRANLRIAMKMLDNAGYKTGPDGIRVHEKTGQKLAFEILESNPAFERWTAPFIQNLQKMGVQATFRVVDDAQYQNRLQNFDFDITTMAIAQSDSPGNEQRDFWKADKADLAGSRNYIGIKDPVIDDLIEIIIQAQHRDDLLAATHALDRVLLWNHYVIPHWHFGAWRLAWWNTLEKPAKLSGISPGISDTWWAKP